MQISIGIDDLEDDDILFCNRAENTVINGGGFYRVMYCNGTTSMIGVHVIFDVDMTIEDSVGGVGSGRLDVREALTTITPSVMDVVSGLTTRIHKKWCDAYGEKPLSCVVTPHSVEPAILKSLIQARTLLTGHSDSPVANSPKVTRNVKMSFVYKCAGVYDTAADSGVSFRLNSVNRL